MMFQKSIVFSNINVKKTSDSHFLKHFFKSLIVTTNQLFSYFQQSKQLLKSFKRPEKRGYNSTHDFNKGSHQFYEISCGVTILLWHLPLCTEFSNQQKVQFNETRQFALFYSILTQTRAFIRENKLLFQGYSCLYFKNF